ncbi:uncharacterized protein MAM_07196 [Metarhizium album ARSEF 1941]|uniref:Uncharacterized protein n=1 Tax=Metarhizium album (strain ARSEF 1941) TaxID=1081103 RepID=A0A0B2WMN9_METAS|nr:uncharacterized protein MAM_07196 [Metarhizium album ARSEF 1941]KHN94969.1 hypothetical protein MAM_07196 [Metarhizium album ARSEF 1941]
MTNFNALLLATSSARLTSPPDPPALSQNFQLIAHVTSPNVTQFTAGIENWEVASLPGFGCDEPLALKRPRGSRTASGTTFWFDPETTSVAYGHGQDVKRLFIPQGGRGERALSMHCAKATPGVEVVPRRDGPQLVHRDNGTFYVCPRRVRSRALAQLLYRQGDELLPYMCADVVLFAKWAKGSSMREESMVDCCTDVRDGVCRFPVQHF